MERDDHARQRLLVSAGVRLTLPTESFFYRNPLGADVRPSPTAIAAHPALAFHTSVTSPHHAFVSRSPSILGSFPENDPPTSFGGAFDRVHGTFSVSWGHPEAVTYPTPVGTYEILRMTFPVEVLPVVHSQSQTWTIAPDQMANIPSIPEPACGAGLVCLAGAALRGVRHRDQRS